MGWDRVLLAALVCHGLTWFTFQITIKPKTGIGFDGPLNASLLRAPVLKKPPVCHWFEKSQLCIPPPPSSGIWCFLGRPPNWNYGAQIKCWSWHKQKRDFSVLFCRIWSIKPFSSVNSARNVEGWSSAINSQLIAGCPMQCGRRYEHRGTHPEYIYWADRQFFGTLILLPQYFCLSLNLQSFMTALSANTKLLSTLIVHISVYWF